MASKKFKVPGGTLTNGVLIADPAVRKDRDAPNGFGRKFGEKHFATPPTTFGAKRQTRGTQSAYHHGVAVQDEPLTTKIGHTGKTVPVHSGMRTATPEARGADYGPGHGSRILGDAGTQSWRSEVGSKHGVARLPIANKR